MHLTGYPIEDLALRPSFVEASRAAVSDLAAQSRGRRSRRPDRGRRLPRPGRRVPPTRSVDRAAPRRTRWPSCTEGASGRPLRQAPPAQLRRLRRVPLLRPGHRHLRRPGARASTSPWRSARTCGRTAGRSPPTPRSRPGLLLVPNGSPYERNKDDVRLALVRRRAAEAGCTLAYVNLVGGQDELVFDGDSIVVTADGEVLARAPQFVEGVTLVDLDLPAADAAAARSTSWSPAEAREPYEPARGTGRRADQRRGRGLRRPRRSACATTPARTASAAWSSASAAASTPP